MTFVTVAAAAMSAVRTAPAQAQESPRPALVIGGLPSLGVFLPIGSRWALRPDISLSGVIQYMGGVAPTSPRSTTRLGGGLSALRLLDAGTDSLRPYLVTRLGYLAYRTGATTGGEDSETFEAQAALGGGVQYQPHDQFGLFVELLADYALQRSTIGGDTFPRVSTLTRWQLRPTIGVTLRRARRATG